MHVLQLKIYNWTNSNLNIPGAERSPITKPALAREWDLMVLDSVSHRELTKTRIQVSDDSFNSMHNNNNYSMHNNMHNNMHYKMY